MGGADGIHQPLRGQRNPQCVPATNSDEICNLGSIRKSHRQQSRIFEIGRQVLGRLEENKSTHAIGCSFAQIPAMAL